MNASEKIVNFLQSKSNFKDLDFSNVMITSRTNKSGNKLFYIRVARLEKEINNNYSSHATYYAFDINGNYVGCVKVALIDPLEVEIEYYANDEYKNEGNITILAEEVIKDLFEFHAFDNLKIRDGQPLSKIDSIMVGINEDNVASLRVAEKLGFNQDGYLYADDYYKQKNNSNGQSR